MRKKTEDDVEDQVHLEFVAMSGETAFQWLVAPMEEEYVACEGALTAPASVAQSGAFAMRICQAQPEPEGGALPDLAVDPYLAAMALDNRFADI